MVLQKCMAFWELKTSLENCVSDDKTEVTSWTDAELMEDARYVLSCFREGGHAFHGVSPCLPYTKRKIK